MVDDVDVLVDVLVELVVTGALVEVDVLVELVVTGALVEVDVLVELVVTGPLVEVDVLVEDVVTGALVEVDVLDDVDDVVTGALVDVDVDDVVTAPVVVVVVEDERQGLCAQEPGPMDVPPIRVQLSGVNCPHSTGPLFWGMQQMTLGLGPNGSAAASAGTNATAASIASTPKA